MGIKYIDTDGHTSGLNMWSTKLPINLISGKISEVDCITGNDIVMMLKDFLFLIRNKDSNHIKTHIESYRNKISIQLYEVLRMYSYLTRNKFDKILQEIKNRIWYDEDIKLPEEEKMIEHYWSFPKIHPNYLIWLIKELQSGKYFTDLLIPLIQNRKKYPIKCKDTYVFPMSDKRHKKNADDYDLSQHIQERE